MRNIDKCPICSTPLKAKNLKGNSFPWKDFYFVEIDEDLILKTCSKCDEVFLTGSDTNKLDKAKEKAIKNQAYFFLNKIKDTWGISQKELAKRVGITEAYLSDIANKKKVVSFQLFNLIKVLANNKETEKDLKSFKGIVAKKGLLQHPPSLKNLARKYTYLHESHIDKLLQLKDTRQFMSINTNRTVN